jgi:hypothetical protein
MFSHEAFVWNLRVSRFDYVHRTPGEARIRIEFLSTIDVARNLRDSADGNRMTNASCCSIIAYATIFFRGA